MQSLGFSSSDRNNIHKLLAAILHLGNVELVDGGDGESSKVANMEEVERFARLVGINAEETARSLTHRVVASKLDVVETSTNAARAAYTRDALAKVWVIHNYVDRGSLGYIHKVQQMTAEMYILCVYILCSVKFGLLTNLKVEF